MNCLCSSPASTCPCSLSTYCPSIHISNFRVRTIIIIIIIRLRILICSPSLRPDIQLLLVNITTVRSFPFLFFLFFSLLLLHHPYLSFHCPSLYIFSLFFLYFLNTTFTPGIQQGQQLKTQPCLRPRLIPPLNASLSSCALSSSSFLTSCSSSYTFHPSLSHSQSFNNGARICLNGGSARLVLGRPCSK